MSHPDTNNGPVNPLPASVIVLVAAMAAAEAVFTLGARGLVGGPEAIGWRSLAIQDYGFSNRAFAWMLENGIFRLDYAVRLFTYPFVHATFTHMLFAAVLTLALGKFVGERLSQLAVLVLFFASAALGALTYALILPQGGGLIGAFPGVYGLIGGFTYLVWLRLGQMGEQQIRAFSLIGILLALQLVFGLFFGTGTTWIADVAGFCAGFLLSFVLVPGGWRRLRSKIRHR
ncbi:rhomboid family intramembrane serine protease [Roseovarius salis]|uniref:rhomboid family intramembrane serine protease n=1 Tax=Roseovarius salis TaxID=3376063 RepID=UPI0037CBCB76